MKRLSLLAILLLTLAAAGCAWLPNISGHAQQVFHIGVDGIDPDLLQQVRKGGNATTLQHSFS